MPLLFLALLQSAVAKPLDLSGYTSVAVDYTMTTKGSTSCTTVYKGAGGSPVVEGDRVTFAGTWEVVSDSCQGNTVWVGADKKAHHTLRLGKGGKSVDEWVVHADASKHQRLESNIKAGGQYWINELDAVPQGGEIRFTLTEEQGMFPLSVTIEHALAIRLSSEQQEQPAKGDQPDE